MQYHRGHDLANYLDLLKAANVAYPVALETSIELTPFGAQLRYDYLPPEERATLSLTRQDMYRLAEQAIAWAAGAVSGT